MGEGWKRAVAAAKASRQTKPKKPPRCTGCCVNYADPPSTLCPGCQAYQEHQS